MQWSHPETVGDIPPPCRAHSATQVNCRIFVFGGGEGPMYFNHLYALDTVMQRWTKISHPPNVPQPISRHAHTVWYYQGKVWCRPPTLMCRLPSPSGVQCLAPSAHPLCPTAATLSMQLPPPSLFCHHPPLNSRVHLMLPRTPTLLPPATGRLHIQMCSTCKPNILQTACLLPRKIPAPLWSYQITHLSI